MAGVHHTAHGIKFIRDVAITTEDGRQVNVAATLEILKARDNVSHIGGAGGGGGIVRFQLGVVRFQNRGALAGNVRGRLRSFEFLLQIVQLRLGIGQLLLEARIGGLLRLGVLVVRGGELILKIGGGGAGLGQLTIETLNRGLAPSDAGGIVCRWIFLGRRGEGLWADPSSAA